MGMELSEAIRQSRNYASGQLRGKGYYYFSDGDTFADALFGAYLGRYKTKGLTRIRDIALKSPTSTAACMSIQRSLMKAWPILGAAVDVKLIKVIDHIDDNPPKKGETLVGYICRLNDKECYTFEQIADVLLAGGL